MWPWPHHRREPTGEPPPELQVTPAEVVQGGELHIAVQGPPDGLFEIEFSLEEVPVPVPAPAPGLPPTPQPARVPGTSFAPLPGLPAVPTSVPVIHPPTVTPQTASPNQLPVWADQVATILALAIVFYGMVAGAQAANIKFGWLVTLAMLAIVWFLRDLIISPLQGLIKAIVLVIFHVLVEVVEFVWQWLQGVAKMFGGDLVRAILQILIVAAFMWVWEQATQIPVIGQLFTWIEETAQTILTWVQTQLNQVATFFDGIRRDLEAAIGGLTKDLGDLGTQLRTLLDDQINGLFTRVQRSIRGLGAEVTGKLGFVVAAANLQVSALAAFAGTSSYRARQYLLAYNRSHPHEHVAEAAGLWASTGHGAIRSDELHGTPWEHLGEFFEDLASAQRGGDHPAREVLDQALRDIRQLQAGETPEVAPIPADELDRMIPTAPAPPVDDGTDPAPPIDIPTPSPIEAA